MSSPVRYSSSCLFTTVRNNVGAARTFGFLPPHGKRLGISEEYSVFGDIYDAVRNGEYATSRRQMQGLQAAIEREDLIIVSTPNPILEDQNGLIKMLVLHSGSLTQYSPCWESASTALDHDV